MAFTWEGYFQLAVELSEAKEDALNCEASWRSAISRAYYAAFIEARNYLLRTDKAFAIPLTPESHEVVRTRFASTGKIEQHRNNGSPSKRLKIADRLDSLRTARNKADYNDVYKDISAREAKIYIGYARVVLDILQGLPPWENKAK